MCYNAIIYGRGFEDYLETIFDTETKTNDDGFFIEKNGKIVRTIDKEEGKTALLQPNTGRYQHFHFRAVSAGSHDLENVHGWEWNGFRVSHNGYASGGTYTTGRSINSYYGYDGYEDVAYSNCTPYSTAHWDSKTSKFVSASDNKHEDTDSLEFLKSVEVPKEFTDDEIIRVFTEAIDKKDLYGVLYVSKEDKSYVFSVRKPVHIYVTPKYSMYISNEAIDFVESSYWEIPGGKPIKFTQNKFAHASVLNVALVIDKGTITKMKEIEFKKTVSDAIKSSWNWTYPNISGKYLPAKEGNDSFLGDIGAKMKSALTTIDTVIEEILTASDSIFANGDETVIDENGVSLAFLEDSLQAFDTERWAQGINNAFLNLNKKMRKKVKWTIRDFDYEYVAVLKAFCNKEAGKLPQVFVNWVNKYFLHYSPYDPSSEAIIEEYIDDDL